jgi:uncharacterized protein involved in exopolysaccharide biosynthesis
MPQAVSISAAGADTTSESDPPVSVGSARFRFPLPFDPVRLVAGVLSRWPWLLAAVLLFGSLGAIVGFRLTDPSFAISASLIKRRVPQTVQTSETGQAFRPVDLNDATLLATLLANEPLDLAFKRANNNVPPGRQRSLVEAAQLEGTDIFYITYHSPVSPDDAISFATIWAEEINAYTQRLQQSEAREVRTILEKEVADIRAELDAVNTEIMNFSKESGYLGGDAQVSSVLGKLSQIELDLEAARNTASAKRSQIENLSEQIRHQSPIELQLKTAREELANLRATYTDANPLVQAKLQSIEYLETQIAELDKNPDADLEPFTGTPLGNQIYLSIIGLRNELLEADNRITSLEKQRTETAARLSEFPAIVSGYDALVKKRESHIEGLSLMSNRLKEAEIFASGAPGYWQVFQAPDPRAVVPSSMVKKPAMLGAAGAAAGVGLAIVLTLLLTHRTSRRSILECCAATRAPLITHLPTEFEEDARAAIQHFWITHLAPRLSSSAPVLFWTAALDPADERRLWSMLADTAARDTGSPISVLDLTPDDLWSTDPRPSSLDWNAENTPLPTTPAILRASSLPSGKTRANLASVSHWIAVVAGQKSSLARAVRLRPLTDTYLTPCGGTIAWTERPKGPIRQAADLLSTFLARRFSC